MYNNNKELQQFELKTRMTTSTGDPLKIKTPITIRNGFLINFQVAKPLKRPNRSENYGDIVDKANRDVVGE